MRHLVHGTRWDKLRPQGRGSKRSQEDRILESITLSLEMSVVLGLLAFTVFLFVSEIVRIDLAAVLVMVLLGLISQFPATSNIANVTHLFDGFASNAVISIIAVMIIGAGLDKTGLMSKVAAIILKRVERPKGGSFRSFRVLLA